ncbi:tRNA (adenosine(37)-N6)-threonylcarbamoyltransferase complex dimerization subunit type 1 TsaB [Paenibacillus sp. NFR01]|uniref:tRNA (adenosine(37)-N6)-threonylcarbamoyltransferase complex dimerization subunit type 1 TsaB n=1 Tax=Paenibacillus sp. NFR01 TaxID=1566279 RepID=UPI000B88A48D|nr:tRNA (adenosine(37)-N6)-threonylcarbamoyltransferase complex dimerization subunit type 1 TsaB [Paenibacillus sp. NFR01]
MNMKNNGPRKRLLALDTSTAVLGVAITEQGELIREINATGERNHSVHLLPIIQEALRASETAPDRLEGIAVGIGPGSYTGTRIAVTAAKTLAWAWNVPVIGISSLHALAWGGYQAASAERDSARPETEWIVPLIDARRGQAYTAVYAAERSAPPRRLAADGIRLMADWVLELKQRIAEAETEGQKPGIIRFVGETSLHGRNEVLEPLFLETEVAVAPYELEGRWVGLLGASGIYRAADDAHDLIPNYTQLSEAEANLRRSREGSLNQP